jgi:hypothetical protein
VAQHFAHCVREALKRHAQISRLRREVHAHRPRHQDHDDGLVSSATSIATQLGDAFATSIETSPGNRSVKVAPLTATIDAGTSDNVGADRGVAVVGTFFLHQ